MKPPLLSAREKLLLGLLGFTILFSASLSYGAVSQTKVDAIMKMINDGAMKFSDIPVTGQTKSERTAYYEKVDAGLGDAVEMLATVRNNIRSLMGLSPAYTADEIVGQIIGGVIGNPGTGTGGGNIGGVPNGSNTKDTKLCTNLPNGERYFYVYRSIPVSGQTSYTPETLYNTQDILSKASAVRSLSSSASAQEKKTFTSTAPLDIFVFKGYGTIDSVLTGVMKGQTMSNTYHSGDALIFMRLTYDSDGDPMQCLAPVKKVSDTQKPGTFLFKLYVIPPAERAITPTSNKPRKYQNICAKTLDELRRVNPDTMSDTNSGGYQYSVGYKYGNTDCYSNVLDYKKYSMPTTRDLTGEQTGYIPDSCVIGTHFLAGDHLLECVPRDFATGVQPTSPDCTDSTNSQIALMDATKMIDKTSTPSYRTPTYVQVLFSKNAGELASPPIISTLIDLRTSKIISGFSLDGVQLTNANGAHHMKNFLVSISPCKGDFTSPEARIVTGRYTHIGDTAHGTIYFTALPATQTTPYIKLLQTSSFEGFFRMQNGYKWYVNYMGEWGNPGWYDYATEEFTRKATSASIHTPNYTFDGLYSGKDSEFNKMGRVGHKTWESYWQLPVGAQFNDYALTVYDEQNWLSGGDGSWFAVNPNAPPPTPAPCTRTGSIGGVLAGGCLDPR